MKKICILMCLFCMFLMSCSNDKNETTTSENEQQQTVNDSQKEQVYSRLVILDPAVVEMMYLLEAEDKIVGIAHTAQSVIWPEEKTKKLTSVGTFSKPSIEQIIGLKPDLVILGSHSGTDLPDLLEKQGIKTVGYTANSIQGIFDNFLEVARLIGKEEKANEIIAEQKKKIDEIATSEKLNLKGAFVYSVSPLMAFADDSLPGDIFKLFGITNLTTNVKGDKPILTPEYILQENPDFLLGGMGIATIDDIIVSNPQLEKTTAGKNKNIIIVNSSLLLRGTPRIVDQITELHLELKKIKQGEK